MEINKLVDLNCLRTAPKLSNSQGKKLLEELLVKYPDAQIVGHRDLDESKFCPSFSVRTYLLNEDIKGYKFQDGLTTDADLQELEHNGNE